MTRLVVDRGLDARLAASPGLQRAVGKVAQAVAAQGRANAPDGALWVTARDERVRRSHVRADRQEIPANLRFHVPKVDTGDDANDQRSGFDLAAAPRDPSLPIGNRIACRCARVPLPGAIAARIHVSDTRTVGLQVSARVSVGYPRVAGSEFGEDGDPGSRWLGRAGQTVAALTGARSQRSLR